MPPTRAIILMGLRGSGKSTVGRLLASRLGVDFVDLDDLTPALLGCASAAQALRARGEPAFRAAETEALMDQLQRISVTGPIVLALGGGTPTAPEAPEALRFAHDRCRCEVVYLHADALALRARLEQDDMSARPSLTGTGTLEEIPALYAARDPLYRTLAQRVVEVAGQTPGAIADTIMEWAR